MKRYFKVSELAKLYGLCADTLRYYEEIGLLHPTRGENNYRLYTLNDIYMLNIIRDLRALDLPLEHIRVYAENRSVATTLELLAHEEGLIRLKMHELDARKAEVLRRQQHLKSFMNAADFEPCLRHIESRPCFSLDTKSISEREIDFQLKKLQSIHPHTLKLIGSLVMGARLDGESLRHGVFDRYDHVFFVGDDAPIDENALPEGSYACMLYRGDYSGFRPAYAHLLAFVRSLSLTPIAAPLELYHIEVHDTDNSSEFITEIQLPV